MLVQAKARPRDEAGCLTLSHLANRANTLGNRSVLVAMRILFFARVKPKVSEKTNDAPSGNTLVRFLLLLNLAVPPSDASQKQDIDLATQ